MIEMGKKCTWAIIIIKQNEMRDDKPQQTGLITYSNVMHTF